VNYELIRKDVKNMDLNKFTQKSLEAVQESQNIAIKNGNPQLEEIHIHYSLLTQDEGLIPRVLSYMGENNELIKNEIQREIDKLPKQSGGGGSIYPSRIYTKILLNSEEEAKKFGDEYVGVEHIYISLLKEKDTASEKIFKKYNINLQRFLETLRKIRGNQNITSDNPEAEYHNSRYECVRLHVLDYFRYLHDIQIPADKTVLSAS
jgi:ATP-dependent Clp protease ATP-binding subunit ClpB